MAANNDHPVICVFGSYAPRPGEPLYEQAYAVGKALASVGFIVANGGYEGTMEASAKGAKDAGGPTIGVTCSVFTDKAGRPLRPNRYIDREVPHDNLLSRIDYMVRHSAGCVVLEGGTGTLAEFGIAWEYVAKKVVPPRPIFLLGDFFAPIVENICAVQPKHGRHIHLVRDAVELLEALRRM